MPYKKRKQKYKNKTQGQIVAIKADDLSPSGKLVYEYASLRRYVRNILSETRFKQMSKPRFTDLKQHLINAPFLDADAGGDYDGDDDLGSDAQQQLIDDLTGYLDDKFGLGEISLTVKVNHLPTLPEEGYNKAVHGATYYYDGLHNVELLLASMEDGHTLRELGNAGQKIFEVVMHELLHMQQFLKFSKGSPSMEKWNEFKSSYEKAGGPGGMKGSYFFFDDPSGPSELETFSFQMANELVDSLGKSSAVKLLQLQNPNYDAIRKHSSSFRVIEKQSPDLARPELRDMIKRAKQYAKRIEEGNSVNEAGKKKKKKRDHKAEYKKWGASPKAKKDRAARNRNRRIFEKEGKVKKGDGKEIDHKKPLSKGGSNAKSNLRVVSRKTNRKKGGK